MIAQSRLLRIHLTLIIQQLIFSLLLLLHDITAATAHRASHITHEASLLVQSKAALQLVALEHRHHYVAAEAGCQAEAETGGVDWLVAVEGGGVVQAMVGFAEGDAGAAAGDCAEVDRGKELDETVVPWLCASWLRAGDGRWVVQGIFNTGEPVSDVVVLSSHGASYG